METLGVTVVLILIVMTVIAISSYATIQELRKELLGTKDKLNYYQSAWSRLRYKCPPSDEKEWYNKYFCQDCYQEKGCYWPPATF